MTWPWVVFLVVGVLAMIRLRDRRPLLAVLQIVLPLAVMVFFRDRKPRYLLPMIGPAAVICGYGLWVFLRELQNQTTERWPRIAAIIHFVALGAVCIGVPIAGATIAEMRTITGDPWYTRPLATWMAIGMASLLLLGAMVFRYRPIAIVVLTFVSMLALQAIVMAGYARSPSGASQLEPLANIIRGTVPRASIYDWNEDGRRSDEELAIYLNRTILFADPRTLPMTDHPQVYITRQPRGAPVPEPFPGWTLLDSTRERKNVWWAFVRTD
jgi:hypothetical protein